MEATAPSRRELKRLPSVGAAPRASPLMILATVTFISARHRSLSEPQTLRVIGLPPGDLRAGRHLHLKRCQVEQ